MIVNNKQGSYSAERIELSQVTVAIDSMDNVKRTAEALESMLEQFHEKRDYKITIPLKLLESAEAQKRIFNMVLGSIAGISLLVGGIGIMNIMLATVTERTREIGIRRALGAKRHNIVFQFLVETAVMSATGGIIGVLLGIGVPPLVTHFSGLEAVGPPLVADPGLPDRRDHRHRLRRLPRPTRRGDGPGRGASGRNNRRRDRGTEPKGSLSRIASVSSEIRPGVAEQRRGIMLEWDEIPIEEVPLQIGRRDVTRLKLENPIVCAGPESTR